MMAWQQSIIWTNADPIRSRIYATLEGNELVNKTLRPSDAYMRQ